MWFLQENQDGCHMVFPLMKIKTDESHPQFDANDAVKFDVHIAMRLIGVFTDYVNFQRKIQEGRLLNPPTRTEIATGHLWLNNNIDVKFQVDITAEQWQTSFRGYI